MPTSVTIQTARIDQQTGRVNIVFTDGMGFTWPNVDDFVTEQDQEIFTDKDLMRRIALAIIAVRIGRITNPAQVEGKTLTFDPTINNVLKVT